MIENAPILVYSLVYNIRWEHQVSWVKNVTIKVSVEKLQGEIKVYWLSGNITQSSQILMKGVGGKGGWLSEYQLLK